MNPVAELAAASAVAGVLIGLLIRPFIANGHYHVYRVGRVIGTIARAYRTGLIWPAIGVKVQPPRRERCPAYPAPGLRCWRYTHDTGRHFIDPAELTPLGYERRPF